MRIKLLVAGLVVSVITPMAQASADCGAGYGNAVEVNATTKVVTYSCVKLQEPTPEPIRPVPVAPTHTVVIQTPNQSVGISGSLEAVTEQVAKIAARPQAPLADPCALGNCTKVEVNATTGVTTVHSLTLADLAQRYKDAQTDYQSKVELATAAETAVIAPIVQEIVEPEIAAAEVKQTKVKKLKVKAKKKAAIK